jgi:hypothetical protein
MAFILISADRRVKSRNGSDYLGLSELFSEQIEQKLCIDAQLSALYYETILGHVF